MNEKKFELLGKARNYVMDAQTKLSKENETELDTELTNLMQKITKRMEEVRDTE